MRKTMFAALFGVALFASITTQVHSQTLSGVVNSYTSVVGIDTCENSIVVSTPKGIQPGDRVLLIQMKGAQINSGNTPAFGSITNLGQAGNYEFATVGSVKGAEIRLSNKLQRKYDVAGRVQLVRVASHAGDVTVASPISVQKWDGATGGVIAIETGGKLLLNASIDASGSGFAGGRPSENGSTPSVSDYLSTRVAAAGGLKGEGIAIVLDTYDAGRGAIANGGGGGNSLNAGGGGGSNASAGGIGGKQYDQFSATAIGGVGGYALPYNASDARLFLGGGGGGGQQNDSRGSAGGDGGGIIIIRAAEIVGPSAGVAIRTNGKDAATAFLDGAGGGGAGGTIALEAAKVTGALTLEARGGKGGDNSEPSNSIPACYGPGAGGSGGMIITSSVLPGSVSHSLAGGTPGMVRNTAASCNGTSYGATAGADGVMMNGLSVPEGKASFDRPRVELSSVATCEGEAVAIKAIGGVRYSWSPASGLSDASSGTPLASPTSTASYIVEIVDARGCTFLDSVRVMVDPKPVLTVEGPSTVCIGSIATYTATGTKLDSYNWNVTGGTLQDPQGSETMHVLWDPSGGTLSVSGSNGSKCEGSASLAVTVSTFTKPTIVGGGMLCEGEQMTLAASAGYAEYLWSNGERTSSISVSSAGKYSVYVSDAGGCSGYSDSVEVIVNPTPSPAIVASGTMLANPGGEITLKVGGSYKLLNWSNGATTDSIIVTAPGVYSVSVVDSFGCSGRSADITITQDAGPASATLELSKVEAAPGQRVTVELKLANSENLSESGATEFVWSIRYNRSLLTPVGRTLDGQPFAIRRDGRENVITMTGTRQMDMATGVLAQIQFTACLGDAEATPLTIDSFAWTNGRPVATATVQGEFRLDDLCREPGTRLFKEGNSFTLSAGRPNPARGITKLEYSLAEEGKTEFFLMDMLGRRVLTLFDGEQRPGIYEMSVDLSGVAPGSYYWILQSPTEVIQRGMMIER